MFHCSDQELPLKVVPLREERDYQSLPVVVPGGVMTVVILKIRAVRTRKTQIVRERHLGKERLHLNLQKNNNQCK